jgi:hypothetical protein
LGTRRNANGRSRGRKMNSVQDGHYGAMSRTFVLKTPTQINEQSLSFYIRGAQTAFILFSTFLDLRPVSAANDLQASKNGRLEIRISKSKMPV